MEVISVAQEPPRPGTKRYRERLIRNILATQAGIYGAEVCQVCGQVGTYFSLAGAYGTHYKFHGEFIGKHGHTGSEANAAIKGPVRFCEVCLSRFGKAEGSKVSYHW